MTKETTKKTTTKKAAPKKTTTKKAATNKVVETKKENKTMDIETKKTIFAAVLLIIVLVGGYIFYEYKEDELKKDKVETKIELTEDEKTFKEEYESLNGTKRSNGIENKTVSIPDDNNVEIITMEKAAEIIESGSGVVFFGFAACPWCRNLAPVLINTMQTTNLDKIYYVNVRPDDDVQKDVRGQYKVENKKAVVDIPSAEGYDRVLDKLDEYLNPYTVTDKVTNKQYDTKKKRLGAPTLVAVKNGQIVGFHSGTLEGHVKDSNGVLPDLTKEQEEIVAQSVLKLIQSYLEDSCSSNEEVQTSC